MNSVARENRNLIPMKPIGTVLAALLCALPTVTAFAADPHVEVVIRTVEAAKGKVEKTAYAEFCVRSHCSFRSL